VKKSGKMQRGDIIDVYHTYNKDHIPERNTFFAKVELIKKEKAKHDLPDGYEFWQVKYLADTLGNIPHIGHCILHENGLQLIENLHVQREHKQMVPTDKQRKIIDNGAYLRQIHFYPLPSDNFVERKNWLKQELMNYFGLRCIGSLLWKEGKEPIEGHEHPLFTDEEFDDMVRLFMIAFDINNLGSE
jgi:hypothetical protein